MTKLKNDYIYTYILKYILSYNYIETFKHYPFTVYTFADTEFKHLNIETLNYVLVSKKFFQIISSELSRITKFKNYVCLKYFMDYNGNGKFKLIKQKDSIMVYKSYKDYNISDQDEETKSKFKKILIKENDPYFAQRILLSKKIFSSNIQFELTLFINLYGMSVKYYDIDVMISYKIIRNIKFYKSNFNKFLENPKRIHTLMVMQRNLESIEDSNILLNNINKLGSKQISFQSIENEEIEDWRHISYTPTLYGSSNYKRILICNGLHLPSDYLSITPSLKNFSLVIDFNKLIKTNQTDSLKVFENEWNILFNKKLLLNQSIKFLEISNREEDLMDEENIILQSEFIGNSFYELFSNPKCPIEIIELNDYNTRDDMFFKGLVSNSSIKTIIFYNTRTSIFFEKVFSKNNYQQQNKHSTIRNIIILSSEESIIDILDLVKMVNADLYSLTYECDDGLSLDMVNQITRYINIYKYNIKEYNIYIKSDISIKDPIILLNNGSVLNLRRVSSDDEVEKDNGFLYPMDGYDSDDYSDHD